MKKRLLPDGLAQNENELVCWGGESENGWSFIVVLFRGEPRGEIRFSHHGAAKFTHPIGLEEIAMFKAEREDLLLPYVTTLIAQHRPH